MNDRDCLALLRRDLAAGHTLLGIARRNNVPRARLLQLAAAHGLPYPNRPATRAQRRAVIDAVMERGLSIRAAARVAGISRSAAHRIIWRQREAALRIGPAGTMFEPIPVDPYRCPNHGLTTISPCPACEVAAYVG